MNPAALSGKRALAASGAGGVGCAVTTRMAERGARLFVTDRGELDLRGAVDALRSGTPAAEIEAVTADLSSGPGVARVFERVDEWLGGIDILVACAGVGAGPLTEMADPDWRYVIESNLVGYVACTQRAIARASRNHVGK